MTYLSKCAFSKNCFRIYDMSILQTNRLLIQEFTLEETDFILRLLNTEGWLKYIGDKNIRTIEEARAYLQNSLLQLYATLGFGLWCVRLKENNTPIGVCGLIKRDTLEHTDIGFAFLPEYEQQGYAFEAAQATVAYAFQSLHLPKLLAIVKANNTRSIHLLTKIGLQFEQKIVIKDEELCLFGSLLPLDTR